MQESERGAWASMPSQKKRVKILKPRGADQSKVPAVWSRLKYKPFTWNLSVYYPSSTTQTKLKVNFSSVCFGQAEKGALLQYSAWRHSFSHCRGLFKRCSLWSVKYLFWGSLVDDSGNEKSTNNFSVLSPSVFVQSLSLSLLLIFFIPFLSFRWVVECRERSTLQTFHLSLLSCTKTWTEVRWGLDLEDKDWLTNQVSSHLHVFIKDLSTRTFIKEYSINSSSPQVCWMGLRSGLCSQFFHTQSKKKRSYLQALLCVQRHVDAEEGLA